MQIYQINSIASMLKSNANAHIQKSISIISHTQEEKNINQNL